MDKKRTIRVRNGFSDRNGINPICKEMQLLDFAPQTRIVLFNSVKNILNMQIRSLGIDENNLSKHIVENMFTDIYEPYEDKYHKVLSQIRDLFMNESYDSVLTMIEFLCTMVYESPDHYRNRNNYDSSFMSEYFDVFKEMNQSFEDEYIGYRFVNEKIVKITNKSEIDEIESASRTPYDSVNLAIEKSISLLSESSNKDYENSIKESILAVEELFNILLKTTGLTLGKAADQLFSKIDIDEHLRDAIKSLYKYASDSNGIRHGNNKEKKNVGFDEAKLVLVLCSAVINFLFSVSIN